MAIFDKLSFPDIDGVTGRPTIDGWTGSLDPGLQTNFTDAGYATSGRLSYGGGALAPPVTIQCVRIPGIAPWGLPVAQGDYLGIGFFCTYDYSFDAADGVTIAFLPDTNRTDKTKARRIDILPFLSGTGAGTVAEPENVPPLPGIVGTANKVRFDRAMTNSFTCSKGLNWTAPSDTKWAPVSTPVTNLHGRAASWTPVTVGTTSFGSNSIPATGAFTFTVTNASQFPQLGGQFTVEGNTVSYDGVTANTLTGCQKLAGSGGAVTAGKTVILLDVGWSFEVLIPTTIALGGADWLDLQGHFGLYVNLYRFSELASTATPHHAGSFAAQYRFPLPDLSATNQQYITGTLDDHTKIDLAWYGTGVMPGMAGVVNDAVGVRFQNEASQESSVGARHTAGGPLTDTLDGTTNNILVAQIKNTDPALTAADITAEFRFAKWGIPSASFGDWDPASAHGAALPIPVTLAPGAVGEVTQNWPGVDIPHEYISSSVWPGHHCVWVRLDGPNTVNFVESGTRKNMNFVNLSEHEAEATVSGRGYAPPASGPHHDFVLCPHVRRVDFVGRGGGHVSLWGGEVEGEGQRVWVWVVDASRKTGMTMTVAGTTAEVIEPAGQFGLVAQHNGSDSDVFLHELTGGGIVERGRGYELRVPHNGEVTIKTWIGAGPAGQLKPPSARKHAPWWLRLWRWLVGLWHRLFG